jgi:hypothetical protein
LRRKAEALEALAAKLETALGPSALLGNVDQSSSELTNRRSSSPKALAVVVSASDIPSDIALERGAKSGEWPGRDAKASSG